MVHTFQASFPRAEKVNWQELSDLYVVSFVDNGILSRVMYRKKDGALTSYLRYYLEENLPVNIRSAVKHRYSGRKISGVVELSVPSVPGDEGSDSLLTTVYYIKLEGANTWTTVKVSGDGSMEIVEKFKKAL
jgi:hypothetical protein